MGRAGRPPRLPGPSPGQQRSGARDPDPRRRPQELQRVRVTVGRGLAGHAWTILGTARMARQPRAYLHAYLQACAASGGSRPKARRCKPCCPGTCLPPDSGGRHDHHGTPRADNPARYCGRDFTPAELGQIRAWPRRCRPAARSPTRSATPWPGTAPTGGGKT
jgi:hypothetical protein